MRNISSKYLMAEYNDDFPYFLLDAYIVWKDLCPEKAIGDIEETHLVRQTMDAYIEDFSSDLPAKFLIEDLLSFLFIRAKESDYLKQLKSFLENPYEAGDNSILDIINRTLYPSANYGYPDRFEGINEDTVDKTLDECGHYTILDNNRVQVSLFTDKQDEVIVKIDIYNEPLVDTMSLYFYAGYIHTKDSILNAIEEGLRARVKDEDYYLESNIEPLHSNKGYYYLK